MGTEFLIGGSDLFDTLFEPYTPPYSQGSPVGYEIGTLDLRSRYLQLSQLQNFYVNTSFGTQYNVAMQEATTTDYEHVGKDLQTIFAKKGSVLYGIVIPISVNQQNLDLLTYATNYLQNNFPSLYDSNFSFFNANYNSGANFSSSNPGITFYIESGVVIYSNNNSLPALTVDSFPGGVFVKVLNDGYIAGASGTPGAAGYNTTPGGSGGSGGTAITMSTNVVIDNTNGYIYGGGGGGGGGGPAICQYTNSDLGKSVSKVFNGGLGGTGAGSNNGIISAATNGVYGHGPLQGIDGEECTNIGAYGWYAAFGGNGGTWGAQGTNGYEGSGTTPPTTNWYPDGTGGGAGLAIISNGYTITWLGGSTSPHVLGNVI